MHEPSDPPLRVVLLDSRPPAGPPGCTSQDCTVNRTPTRGGPGRGPEQRVQLGCHVRPWRFNRLLVVAEPRDGLDRVHPCTVPPADPTCCSRELAGYRASVVWTECIQGPIQSVGPSTSAPREASAPWQSYQVPPLTNSPADPTAPGGARAGAPGGGCHRTAI